VFGWAKPVPVNFARLDKPRLGMMLVAAAGPATNIVLAFTGAVALGLYAGTLTAPPVGVSEYVFGGLQLFIVINVFLALFNLLPIPPFDGSHIVEGMLPRSWAAQYGKLRNLGMLLFVALIAITWAFPDSGIIETVLGPPVEWVQSQFFALAAWIAGA
jgi:Zn-dependent protease